MSLLTIILKLLRFCNIIIRYTNVYFIIQQNDTFLFFPFRHFLSLLMWVKPYTLKYYSSTKCHNMFVGMIFGYKWCFGFSSISSHCDVRTKFLCSNCFPQVMIREMYMPVLCSLVHLIIFENLIHDRLK